MKSAVRFCKQSEIQVHFMNDDIKYKSIEYWREDTEKDKTWRDNDQETKYTSQGEPSGMPFVKSNRNFSSIEERKEHNR